MEEPPRIMAPLPRDQRNIDIDHLNLLSIFHFVGAGLAVMGALIMMLEYAFMHFAMTHSELFQNQPAPWQNIRQARDQEFFLGMMGAFYGVIGLWFVASLILNLLSGFFLRERRHRTFSLVVAAINCVHLPLGTVLGIFTIIVLSRNSVRELYEQTEKHG